MNFFKSILSDDLDPPDPDNSRGSQPSSPPDASQQSDDENDVDNNSDSPDANSNPDDGDDDSSAGAGISTSTTTNVGGWSFGGLMKTFATRSESVLETYRRDLQEFGSGLKKESVLFREVASRAVKDLPASIEIGASVAHGSLESVTQAIDGVIKSTADIISHGKESMISSSDVDSDTPDTGKVSGSGRYNRFDAQLNAIQNDMNTFCEEPEDLEDYMKWKLEFVLNEKAEDIENLIGENGILEGAHKKFVPNVVDDETFWCRYFYRVHKLKQQESVRANLVRRAIAIDDEEELTWDVDDDDDNNLQEKDVKSKGDDELDKKASGEQRTSPVAKQESTSDEPQSSSLATMNESGENKSSVDNVDKGDKVRQLTEVSVPEEMPKLESSSQVKNEEIAMEDDHKAGSDAKGDQGEPGKESDTPVVSSQQSVHEEDMGWDEIEYIGSGDEKKANPITQGGSPNSTDVRKRLSTAEEDEDLTWDIEDDD